MKKYAVVILAVRDDLMEGMAKTFFYKNKVKDLDVYVAVEDRMGLDDKKIKSICRSSNNPNFKNARVIKMTNWTDSFIKSMGNRVNKKFGADFLRINQKSGFNLPQIDLLNKGYSNVLLLEEDQFVVGPIMEILESEHTVAQTSFGSAGRHNGNKSSNFYRMDMHNNIKVSESEMEKMGGLNRNPYCFAKNSLKHLTDVFMNYMNDEECFKRWIMSSQKGRKTEHRGDGVPTRIDSVEKIYDKWKETYGEEVAKAYALPGDIWEDHSKLNCIIMYKMVKDPKISKVFPMYPKLGPSISAGNGMPDNKLAELCLKGGYIIHYTYGAKKGEAAKALIKSMNALGYKGEFTADKFITKRQYNWQKEPQWLKSQMNKGIGSEWKEMYRNGTWLNPDYLKMIGKEKEEIVEE